MRAMLLARTGQFIEHRLIVPGIERVSDKVDHARERSDLPMSARFAALAL